MAGSQDCAQQVRAILADPAFDDPANDPAAPKRSARSSPLTAGAPGELARLANRR
jgi:hypothetical protein